MSIIIKDIDLPKNDKPLNLEIYSDGHIWINWGPEYERKNNVAIQIERPHGRLKDFDGNGIHPIIVDGEYMVKVDDLDKIPTILGWEE